MAEEHPPSPEPKERLVLFRRLTRFASSNRGFAGQARNDEKGEVDSWLENDNQQLNKSTIKISKLC